MRIAVNGGRRGEDQCLDVGFRHDLKQCHAAREIVVVITQRLGHRLADGLEAGEVDDGIDLVFAEDIAQRAAIADIDLRKTRCTTADASDTFEYGRLAVGKIVDDDKIVSGVEQFDAGVGADIASAAGNENGLHDRSVGFYGKIRSDWRRYRR